MILIYNFGNYFYDLVDPDFIPANQDEESENIITDFKPIPVIKTQRSMDHKWLYDATFQELNLEEHPIWKQKMSGSGISQSSALAPIYNMANHPALANFMYQSPINHGLKQFVGDVNVGANSKSAKNIVKASGKGVQASGKGVLTASKPNVTNAPGTKSFYETTSPNITTTSANDSYSTTPTPTTLVSTTPYSTTPYSTTPTATPTFTTTLPNYKYLGQIYLVNNIKSGDNVITVDGSTIFNQQADSSSIDTSPGATTTNAPVTTASSSGSSFTILPGMTVLLNGNYYIITGVDMATTNSSTTTTNISAFTLKEAFSNNTLTLDQKVVGSVFSGTYLNIYAGNNVETTPYGSSTTPYGSSTTPYGSSTTPYGSSKTPYGSSKTPYGSSTTPRGMTTTTKIPNFTIKLTIDKFTGKIDSTNILSITINNPLNGGSYDPSIPFSLTIDKINYYIYVNKSEYQANAQKIPIGYYGYFSKATKEIFYIYLDCTNYPCSDAFVPSPITITQPPSPSAFYIIKNTPADFTFAVNSSSVVAAGQSGTTSSSTLTITLTTPPPYDKNFPFSITFNEVNYYIYNSLAALNADTKNSIPAGYFGYYDGATSIITINNLDCVNRNDCAQPSLFRKPSGQMIIRQPPAPRSFNKALTDKDFSYSINSSSTYTTPNGYSDSGPFVSNLNLTISLTTALKIGEYDQNRPMSLSFGNMNFYIYNSQNAMIGTQIPMGYYGYYGDGAFYINNVNQDLTLLFPDGNMVINQPPTPCAFNMTVNSNSYKATVYNYTTPAKLTTTPGLTSPSPKKSLSNVIIKLNNPLVAGAYALGQPLSISFSGINYYIYSSQSAAYDSKILTGYYGYYQEGSFYINNCDSGPITGDMIINQPPLPAAFSQTLSTDNDYTYNVYGGADTTTTMSKGTTPTNSSNSKTLQVSLTTALLLGTYDPNGPFSFTFDDELNSVPTNYYIYNNYYAYSQNKIGIPTGYYGYYNNVAGKIYIPNLDCDNTSICDSDISEIIITQPPLLLSLDYLADIVLDKCDAVLTSGTKTTGKQMVTVNKTRDAYNNGQTYADLIKEKKYYNSSGNLYSKCDAPFTFTNGTQTTGYGWDYIVTFNDTNNNGTITFFQVPISNMVLLVGGGGGAGWAGGGAGGLGYGTLEKLSSDRKYTITIGKGGAYGGDGGWGAFLNGTNGGSSTIKGGDINEIAYGGGGGGGTGSGNNGGSGGGGSGTNATGGAVVTTGGVTAAGSGALTYSGNAGGGGSCSKTSCTGGGGGGSGGAGYAYILLQDANGKPYTDVNSCAGGAGTTINGITYARGGEGTSFNAYNVMTAEYGNGGYPPVKDVNKPGGRGICIFMFNF